jgi:hypothetical protein
MAIAILDPKNGFLHAYDDTNPLFHPSGRIHTIGALLISGP